MGDCNDTLRELERFLDGELPETSKHVIQRHLDGCLDCLSTYDFHAELKIVISHKARSEDMPEGLMARIEQCFGDLDDED